MFLGFILTYIIWILSDINICEDLKSIDTLPVLGGSVSPQSSKSVHPESLLAPFSVFIIEASVFVVFSDFGTEVSFSALTFVILSEPSSMSKSSQPSVVSYINEIIRYRENDFIK